MRQTHSASSPLGEWLSAVPPAARPWVARVVGVDRFAGAYEAACRPGDGRPFADRALDALGIDWRIDGGVELRVPQAGAVIVVANHPFGGVEGLVMASEVLRVRADMRLMANGLLAGIPELRPYLIQVNPFGGASAARENLRGLRESLRWLRSGGVLGIFPSGEVAHLRWRDGRIREPDWNSAVAWLARESGAAIVPLHFCGTNGPLFHLAGLVHPRLRTALLPRELLNKRHRPLTGVMGPSVAAERLRSFDSDPEAARYLQFRTQLLAQRQAAQRLNRRPVTRQPGVPIAAAVPAGTLAGEIAALPPDACLARHREWGVYVTSAAAVPRLMQEIGRLREITFRACGEGTGKAVDLDRYDAFYRHLVLWNHVTSEVAGGYRVGLVDHIVPRHGSRGLYSRTLFRYGRPLLRRLTPGLELGRSFVRPEHQRAYLPLLLLWKGLGAMVAREPQRRMLFGTVSMSNDYTALSRSVVARFFMEAGRKDPWSRWVQPRHPLRDRPVMSVLGPQVRLPIPDIETLNDTVEAIEPDGKGLPVLLRHYLKLGGQVLGFNVDTTFQSVLDAFIVVDLAKTEPRYLELYLGADGARRFLEAHGPRSWEGHR